MLCWGGGGVTWCLMPSQPVQLYQGEFGGGWCGVGEGWVTWCLMPSQPVQLYQGEFGGGWLGGGGGGGGLGV